MVCYKIVYYNLLAIGNNIIINFLLLGNIIYPNYYNNKIIEYKKKGDTYYNFILFLNFGETIKKNYNINIIDLGLQLYDNLNNNSNIENDESDLSDLSDLSDIED